MDIPLTYSSAPLTPRFARKNPQITLPAQIFFDLLNICRRRPSPISMHLRASTHTYTLTHFHTSPTLPHSHTPKLPHAGIVTYIMGGLPARLRGKERHVWLLISWFATARW